MFHCSSRILYFIPTLCEQVLATIVKGKLGPVTYSTENVPKHASINARFSQLTVLALMSQPLLIISVFAVADLLHTYYLLL